MRHSVIFVTQVKYTVTASLISADCNIAVISLAIIVKGFQAERKLTTHGQRQRNRFSIEDPQSHVLDSQPMEQSRAVQS